MSKQEFIDRLRSALNGRIAPGLVMDHVKYYEDYINTEIRKGKTEHEVLQILGDPRLIARTIIETNGKSSDNTYQDAGYQNNAHQSNSYQGADYQNGGYYQSGDSNQRQLKEKIFHLPGWVWAVIVILIVVVIISTIFSVLSFLAPVIIPIAFVAFLVKLFRDWLN